MQICRNIEDSWPKFCSDTDWNVRRNTSKSPRLNKVTRLASKPQGECEEKKRNGHQFHAYIPVSIPFHPIPLSISTAQSMYSACIVSYSRKPATHHEYTPHSHPKPPQKKKKVACTVQSNPPLPLYQLKYFLPLARLLAKIFRPLCVFNLARNPWRRFCTRRLGLNVFRLAPRAAEEENGREVAPGEDNTDDDSVPVVIVVIVDCAVAVVGGWRSRRSAGCEEAAEDVAVGCCVGRRRWERRWEKARDWDWDWDFMKREREEVGRL